MGELDSSEPFCVSRELSERIGLEPDRTALKGSPQSAKSSHRHKFHQWEIRSRVPESSEPNAHIEDVLSRIASVADRLEALAASGEVQSIRLWLHVVPSVPGLSFAQRSLGLISRFGSLEISLLHYEDVRDESKPKEHQR